MKQGPELSFDDDGRPVLITRAAPPYEVEHRKRVRKYLTLMAFRIPALILAAGVTFLGSRDAQATNYSLWIHGRSDSAVQERSDMPSPEILITVFSALAISLMA